MAIRSLRDVFLQDLQSNEPDNAGLSLAKPFESFHKITP